MLKRRVYELASELGLTSKNLIQRLQALGFNHITSHANSLTQAEIDEIKKKLGTPFQDAGHAVSPSDVVGGYAYDIFISYRRREPVMRWVQEHFYERLHEWLSEKMTREPNIFIDKQIETGAPWRDELRVALQTSRFLVPIWSPSYFRSSWCLAEWQTMLAREKQLGLGVDSTPKSLIYPILFASEELLPEKARATQHQDFSSWNINWEAFKSSNEYGCFVRAIQYVATDLGQLIPQAPKWQPNWPVCMPEPASAGVMGVPRLR